MIKKKIHFGTQTFYQILAGFVSFLVLVVWHLNTYQSLLVLPIPPLTKTEITANSLFNQFSNEQNQLIRRVFTGEQELPFIDFLLLKDHNQNLITIFYDTSITFFTSIVNYLPDLVIGFFSVGFIVVKIILVAVCSFCILKIILLKTKFKYNHFEFLLAYILSLIWNNFSYNSKFVFFKNSLSF